MKRSDLFLTQFCLVVVMVGGWMVEQMSVFSYGRLLLLRLALG